MGSNHLKASKLAGRCCYGACFALGFLVTALFLTIMFWIVWCYLGLTVVPTSVAQRRALVNYSVVASKTTSPLPLSNRTDEPAIEGSINMISESATTSIALQREDRRGELPPKFDKRKDPALAKGDFAARDRANVSKQTPERALLVAIATNTQGGWTSLPQRTVNETKMDLPKATVSRGGDDDSEKTLHTRRVSTTTKDNLPLTPQLETVPDKNPMDASLRAVIAPTRVHNNDEKSSSRNNRPRDDQISRERTVPKDYPESERDLPRRDDIQSSRRLSPSSVDREPEFEKEYPRSSYSSRDGTRRRYQDDDDDRGSRSRYDTRDRGRDTDDRYSKGDTRVYPDDDRRLRDRTDRPVSATDDYKYRERKPLEADRYPDNDRRRGDDERYRESIPLDADRYPTDYRRRGDDDRYSERIPLDADRYPDDDKRRGDDDKYRKRIPLDPDRYPDDDRYRGRDSDDRYSDSVRVKEDRYRDEYDEYRDSSRPREDGRSRAEIYRPREEDRFRTRDDERPRDRVYEDRRVPNRDSDYRYSRRGEEDRLGDESGQREPIDRNPLSNSRSSDLTPLNRKPPSLSRDATVRDDDRNSGYESSGRDRSPTRSMDVESRSRTQISSKDRYSDDDYRRPSTRYDDPDRIVPSRVRDEFVDSKSAPRVDDMTSRAASRSRDVDDKIPSRKYDRYPKEDSYYPEDRGRGYYEDEDRRIANSRSISPSSVVGSGNSRRPSDNSREYRTRLPDERRTVSDSRGEVDLDPRSYASDEDDEYRRSNSRRSYADRHTNNPKPDDDDERVRKTRPDDDVFSRGRPRGDYDTNRPRERYDREDDDRYVDYRPPSRSYDRYPAEDDRTRRDPEDVGPRKDDTKRELLSSDRERRYRPEDREDRPGRFSDRDDYPDVASRHPDQSSAPPRTRTTRRNPPTETIVPPESSRVSDDIVVRGKRFHSSASVPFHSETPRDIGKDEPRMLKRDSNLAERPLSAQDVIETALRQSDVPERDAIKAIYPVFDPRVSNLTSSEIIKPSERRGITLMSKRRRRST